MPGSGILLTSKEHKSEGDPFAMRIKKEHDVEDHNTQTTDNTKPNIGNLKASSITHQYGASASIMNAQGALSWAPSPHYRGANLKQS